MKLSRRAIAHSGSGSGVVAGGGLPAPPPLQLLGTIGSAGGGPPLSGGGTTTISLAALPRPLPAEMMKHVTPNPPALQHHPIVSATSTTTNNNAPHSPPSTPPPPPTLQSASGSATAAAAAGLMLATSASAAVAASDSERIFLKCRVCLTEILDHNNPNVNIFSKDFLDEKIRRYLYVNIDFTDKYPKRICQICLIKLDDIHGFACTAQKNQQILRRFRDNQRAAEAVAAAAAAAATAAAAAAATTTHQLPMQTTIRLATSPPTSAFALTSPQQSQHPAKSLSSPRPRPPSTSPSASQHTPPHKTTLLSNNDITIFAYDDLKLGQFIKDPDLLTLILKALKWDSQLGDKNAQLERLRQSNFQDVLANSDLLQDEDLMQLLGPYTNREPSLSITRQPSAHGGSGKGGIGGSGGGGGGQHHQSHRQHHSSAMSQNSCSDDTAVTEEMEVGVDPDLFFPFDDDETRSAEEAVATAQAAAAAAAAVNAVNAQRHMDVKPILCMECPQLFSTQAELHDHNKLKHDTSVRLVGGKRKREVTLTIVPIDTGAAQPPLNLSVPKGAASAQPPHKSSQPATTLMRYVKVEQTPQVTTTPIRSRKKPFRVAVVEDPEVVDITSDTDTVVDSPIETARKALPKVTIEPVSAAGAASAGSTCRSPHGSPSAAGANIEPSVTITLSNRSQTAAAPAATVATAAAEAATAATTTTATSTEAKIITRRRYSSRRLVGDRLVLSRTRANARSTHSAVAAAAAAVSPSPSASASASPSRSSPGAGASSTHRFTCQQCGRKLSTKGNLKVHMETHKPKGKYSCEKCGRVFKTTLNLARHKKYHSGEKFSCPHCARVYPTNSTLRAHIITHSNVRPHECPMCFKTFKRNQDLKFHINQHTGDKPYKCPHCPKAFASSGNCFSHRKRMHADKDKN